MAAPRRQPAGPRSPDARERAERAYRAGDFSAAADHARRALRADDNSAMHRVLGEVLTRCDRASEGLGHLETARDRDPENVQTWCELANAYRALDRPDDAHRALDRALAITPGNGVALRARAQLHQARGDNEAAFETVAGPIEEGADDPSLILAYASICRDVGRIPSGIDMLRKLLATGPQPYLRRVALFQLGHLLDATGSYDSAFGSFQEANALDPPGPTLNPWPVIRAWSSDRLGSIPVARCASELPVLIVGMPRSGTSLTEQIIAAHPLATGVGESTLLGELSLRTPPENLDAHAVEVLAGEYVEMLERAAGPGVLRVTDKMPGNFVNLGLATKLLPAGRLVHCVRDPRDTCLSCFFQNFGPVHTYTRTLAGCAGQYLAYRKIMDHWVEVIDAPILHFAYESLIEDPAGRVRDLLAHLGIDDDERCLRFHETGRHVRTASATQVSRPLFPTSRQRWRNYEKNLGPMLRVLEGLPEPA